MVELVCYNNSERNITIDNPNYTTEHGKGQHLLNEERYEMEVRLKDGWSIYNGEVLYTNPLKNARLSDEKIAIATCLLKTKEYCDNSVSFYDTSEAFFYYMLLS